MSTQNISQLIQSLAIKAGIQTNDQRLIDVLSNSEISKIVINPDLFTEIDNSLLSLKHAKNNHSEIKSHYDALSLNAIDAKLKTIIGDVNFSDKDIAEIEGEKSTYKKIELAFTKLKELKPAADPNDKTPALQAQVKDLLKQLQDKDTEVNTKIAAVDAERVKDKISEKKANLYATYKTTFDDLSPTARKLAIDAVIEEQLGTKDAEFYINDKGDLDIRKKDGTTLAGANHVPYIPKAFIDETFAQNKILIVSDPEKKPVDANGKVIVVAPENVPSGNNQTVANLNRKQREAFEANNKAKV